MKMAPRVVCGLTAMFLYFGSYALALTPLNLSPASNDGAALVISGCPTFSWSEVSDAFSYRVVVFELGDLAGLVSYNEMVLLKQPIIDKTIPDRAYSWTPPADKSLCGGSYVWYVGATTIENDTEWSEGKLFKVDALNVLEAIAEKCLSPNNEVGAINETFLESADPDSRIENGLDALSLEQVIFSKTNLKHLEDFDGDSTQPEETLGDKIVLNGGAWASNTLYGNFAGNNLGSEVGATFIGAYAGYSNTTGDSNTFIGKEAGYKNTTGVMNTVVGHWAFYSNIDGSFNTIVGRETGYQNTEGSYNTFVGVYAGHNNETGNNNTCIGVRSGYNNAEGEGNTFVGYSSGKNTTASYNTFIGSQAGQENNEGDSNIFIGYATGFKNTTGSDNTFVGKSAGWYNTEGKQNIFIGNSAGYENTIGQENTFVGFGCGYSNTYGTFNTYLGKDAGYSGIGGNANTFIGNSAGYENTKGESNTFVGYSAGYNNTEGNSNTFVGLYSGRENIAGHENTFLGQSAGYSNEAGSQNTFLGRYAGFTNTNGSGNVFIGFKSGYYETSSGKLYIDNTPTTRPLVYGDFNKRFLIIHGQVQMASPPGIISDARMKRDIQPLESSLEKVLALQGVSYYWNAEAYPEWGFEEKRQIGLLAQDVEAVIPELVSTDSQGHKTVAYDKVTAILVEAIKGLKAENEMLKAQLIEKTEQQQSQIDELQALFEKLSG